MTQRSRGYCFTINNPTFKDHYDMLTLADMCDYFIFGIEKGSIKETPHIQGYLYKHNKINFNTVKKHIPRAHIEIAKGTPEQNTIYCSKEGHYLQFGVMPSQGTITWERLEEVMQNPKQNVHLYNQYRRAYNEIKSQEKKVNHERCLYFIHEDKRFLIPSKSILMNGDIETYEGEDVIVLKTYTMFEVSEWINGFPPKIRRGYEIIKVDPQAIYITYSDNKELNALKKKYLGIVYECPTLGEELIDDTDQELELEDVPWSGHPESFH